MLAVGNGSYLPRSQLTWFDEDGKRLETLGDPAQIFGFAVSPDRTQAVIERIDQRANSAAPWIIQLSSGFTSPLIQGVEGESTNSPVWSNDGHRIIYRSKLGMTIAPLPSRGAEEHWPTGVIWPQSTSPDGQFLLVNSEGATTSRDLMLVPLSGDHEPRPYLNTAFYEEHGRFSPDGRFVAYVSRESGQSEVYVQSFPQADRKRRVSVKGGEYPEWGQDGKQLYFLQVDPADGKASMMVADVAGSSVPRKLFEVPPQFRDSYRSCYAVFDNGRRFLISVLAPDTAPHTITIGLNWTAVLKK